MSNVLEIRELCLQLPGAHGPVHPVEDVTLNVAPGECLGLVGESGSGKSLTLRAILGLLPRGAQIAAGGVRFAVAKGQAPQPCDPRQIRGHGAAMVFQEPMTALNPCRRVGALIADAAIAAGVGRRAARTRALELMAEVGIPDPRARSRSWPHELSGGLRQRVMIAMALASEPRLLLCDEPTTALDVTVQDQILGLLERLRAERGLAMIFVSHDLAVVGQIAQRVAVMYAGRVVETGETAELFAGPRHPYSRALLAAMPAIEEQTELPHGIPGRPPDPGERAEGCAFAPRCPLAAAPCLTEPPPLETWRPGRATACLRYELLSSEAMR